MQERRCVHPPHFPGIIVRLAVLCAATCFFLGCSGQGAGASTRMTGQTGGATGLGGQSAAGGIASSGGTTGGAGAGVGSSGGQLGGGGDPGTGGLSTMAGNSGGTPSGGAAATGGTTRRGGSLATGGVVDGGVDGRTPADATLKGGSTTDGASATGGAGGTGGSGDRCDVGVYDPASPPKVLALSGNLVTHDPSALVADGSYYLYFTGLGAVTSTNMTTWRAAAKPFGTPGWMSSTISGVTDLWAPDISEYSGKYHLYYSGSTFGSNKSCIGHATRDSLATGAWTDDGAPTICSNINSSDNWNAIDPNLVIDTAGAAWLAFGSFWSGIKVIQLNSGGERVGSTVTAIANRPSSGGALEAPFMVRRCGYYYLFMSWDSCCKGANSTYNIRVVRGTSVTGPFVDKAGTAALQGGGTLLSQGDSTFAGPGGQSVMFVGKQAFLVYHAYAKSNGAITLRIADLVWDADGWPVPVGP